MRHFLIVLLITALSAPSFAANPVLLMAFEGTKPELGVRKQVVMFAQNDQSPVFYFQICPVEDSNIRITTPNTEGCEWLGSSDGYTPAHIYYQIEKLKTKRNIVIGVDMVGALVAIYAGIAAYVTYAFAGTSGSGLGASVAAALSGATTNAISFGVDDLNPFQISDSIERLTQLMSRNQNILVYVEDSNTHDFATLLNKDLLKVTPAQPPNYGHPGIPLIIYPPMEVFIH